MAGVLPLGHEFVDCHRLCGTCHSIPRCDKSREEHEPNGTPIRDAAQELELRWKAEAEAERVKLLLGKAAQEIHCAGPVDHRIRVMRREYSDLVIRLTARAEKAEAALRRIAEQRLGESTWEDLFAVATGCIEEARAALAAREAKPCLCKMSARPHTHDQEHGIIDWDKP